MQNEELVGRLIQKLVPYRKLIYLLFIPLVVFILIFSLPQTTPQPINNDPVALPKEFSACRENPMLKHRIDPEKKFNQPADFDLTILIAGNFYLFFYVSDFLFFIPPSNCLNFYIYYVLMECRVYCHNTFHIDFFIREK